MADMDTALENLIDLTDRKIKHLREILDITHKQKEAIENQNIDMLIKYTNEKQQHINLIDNLDEQFQKIYESIRIKLKMDNFDQQSEMSAEESGLYGEFKSKVQKVQNIVKIIFRLERENNEKAKQVMESLKGKIRAISVGQKGYKAYKTPSVIAGGVYLDKKS